MNTLAPEARALAQHALQANKDHQYALKVYTERLDAELQSIEKLLAAADVSDNEDELDLDVGGEVVIPNSVRATGLITSAELLAQKSSFHTEAVRRQKYVEATVIHPMKGSELEALTEAVRSENHRIHALEAQQRGEESFRSLEGHPPSFFEQNTVGINWERVAQKVSSSGSGVKRTAKECEIRWLGDRHPRFNQNPWAQSEFDRLKDLVSDAVEGQVDWTEISTKLGTGRTPVDCMRHAITRRVHVWTPEADAKLLEAVKIYGTDNWLLVARTVSEDATAAQCQSRYTRTLDPTIKHGAWTEEEDVQLKRAVEVFNHSWMEVAAFIPGRNNEQCRDRYQEHLNPKISRGKWSEAQDRELLEAYEQVGAKWREISQMLGGTRTDNMCRSRHNILMRQKTRKSKASSSATTPAPSADATPAQTPGPVEQSPIEESTPQVAGPSRPRPRPRPVRKPTAAVTEQVVHAKTKKQPMESSAPARGGLQSTGAPVAEDENLIIAQQDLPVVVPGRSKGKSKGSNVPPRAPKAAKRKTASSTESQPSAKRWKGKPAVEAEAEGPIATPEANASLESELTDVASLPSLSKDVEDIEPHKDSSDESSPRVCRGRGSARGRGRGRGRGAARGRSERLQMDGVTSEGTSTTVKAGEDASNAATLDSQDSPARAGKSAATHKRAKPSAEPTRRMSARSAARRSLVSSSQDVNTE